MPGKASTARRFASSTPDISSRRCPFAGCAPPVSTCATQGRDGEQFGFSIAGGRIRGHIDGVIVAGPDIGITWPALFEHKALEREVLGGPGQARRRALEADLLRPAADLHGLHGARARRCSPRSTRTARRSITRSSPSMHAPPRRSPTRPSTSSAPQKSGELPPRIAASPDFYLCRWCAYAERCWEGGA